MGVGAVLYRAFWFLTILQPQLLSFIAFLQIDLSDFIHKEVMRALRFREEKTHNLLV